MTTYSGPHRPTALRLANAFGAAMRGLGIRVPRLDLRALLRATGIEDAHLDKTLDAAFIDRLQALLDDADGAARLNHVGRYVLRARLARMLAARLRVRQWLIEHPRTLDVPVDRPLFIVGPPRSGTSLLYDLLAQDPQVRAPRLWEADSPVPPPVPDGGPGDPRHERCARDLARLRKYAPDLAIAHELGVDAPHECFALLEASAFSPTFLIYLHAPAYWKRFLAASAGEAREAYALFRRQVQIFLVRAQGRRWVSKSPAHMGFLASLGEAFPDCAVVSTRREPLESIPSLCSLTAMIRSIGSDDVRPVEIGREMLDGFVECARREDVARASIGDSRMHDVTYARLTGDPVGVVKEIYERFDYPYTQVFERRMHAWLAAHPPHAHGVHRYSLEQFGLDREEVFAATGDYRRRYLP